MIKGVRRQVLACFISPKISKGKLWYMTVAQKFELFGSAGARILAKVSRNNEEEDAPEQRGSGAEDGSADDVEQPSPKRKKRKKHSREKDSKEPLLYHGAPSAMFEELCHAYDAVGAIALAGDGTFALVCLERGIKFFGWCWTEKHVKAVQRHLEKMLWKRSLDPDSKVYNAAVAAIMAPPTDSTEPAESNLDTPPRVKGRKRRFAQGLNSPGKTPSPKKRRHGAAARRLKVLTQVRTRAQESW